MRLPGNQHCKKEGCKRVAEKGYLMGDYTIETMGERLKRLRLDKKLRQEQLAQRLGVSISTVSSYEMDVRQPPYDILAKYAAIFRVSADYLIGGSSSDATINAAGLNQEELHLITGLVDDLTEKNKQLKEYQKKNN